MWENEPDVAVGDDTATVKQQAAARGWQSDFFNFGKAEAAGKDFFNPGLVRRPDGLWLLPRVSEARDGMPYGHNQIAAIKLEGKTPAAGVILKFPNSKEDEQFEDPRAVYWNGQTWVACVNFTWFANGSWTGAHQMLGIFKDQGNGTDITPDSWSPLARRDPIVGTNRGSAGHTHGKHNKNLTYFFLRDTLYCVYTSDPWKIVQFGSTWEHQIPYVSEGVTWKYGIVRGGTPPVLVGDKFFTFFHSSMPWRGRYRRYFMGAIAFEPGPPFRPLLWTQEPILIGSQNDPWKQRKPLVVFPCGALLEGDKWLITFGINDLKSAWIEIPHEDLLKLLQKAPEIPGLALLSDTTPIPDYEMVPFSETDEEEDLPVPVLAETVSSQEAREKQHEPERPTLDTNKDSRGGQTSPDGISPDGKIDLRPREGESTEDWKRRLDNIESALRGEPDKPPPKKKRGRPKKEKN